jgi:hypothetical protein
VNTVHIRSDGKIVDVDRIVDHHPLRCLGVKVELDPGFTLRSFFSMVSDYPLLAEVSVFLPNLLEQYRSCPAGGCTASGLQRLQLSRIVEMIGFPGPPRLEIYTVFQGIDDGKTIEIKTFGIEDLLDIVVTLGPTRHMVFGDKVDVFEFASVFNLFELIDGIAWSLSFHGTPRQCRL